MEVDKKYDELYFKEDLLKKGEKLPKKIKESIKHGKESYEKPLNLKFLINDCLNIENDIKDINIIKENINKCNDIESEIKFSPEENEKNLNEFLLNIKNFGSFSYYDKKEKNKNKSDYKYDVKKEDYNYNKNENQEKEDNPDNDIDSADMDDLDAF